MLQRTILSLSALGGLIIGVVGLRTWKEEIEGRSRHELAMRLMTATLELRDSLKASLLSPVVFESEVLPEEPSSRDDSYEEAEEINKVLANKYRQNDHDLFALVRVVQGLLRETEVLWDVQIKSRFMPLLGLASEVSNFLGLKAQLKDPSVPEYQMREIQSVYANKRNPLDKLKDRQSFLEELDASVNEIRSVLFPHLRS